MRIFFFLVLLLCPFSEIFAGDLYYEIAHGINLIRVQNGLETLSVNRQLCSAAQSQSDWMARVRRMDHLRACPAKFDEFKVCNYHPVNRVINSGYFRFEDLFDLVYNPDGSGVVSNPKPIANTNIGEIIAAGRGQGPALYHSSVILRGWMNSPGHRKAILTSNFKEFGVGISGIPGEVYWCVVFANR